MGILTGTFAFAGFFSFIATAVNFGSSSDASWITVPLSIAAVSAGFAIGAAASRLALRYRPAKTVLKFSLAAMVFASLGLGAMVAAGLSITAIVAFASVYSLLAGAAMPNATVLAMTPSTGSATFAVALLGMSKMVCASLVTWLAVWWPGSSSTYLALTMFICATVALLAMSLSGTALRVTSPE